MVEKSIPFYSHPPTLNDWEWHRAPEKYFIASTVVVAVIAGHSALLQSLRVFLLQTDVLCRKLCQPFVHSNTRWANRPVVYFMILVHNRLFVAATAI